MLIITLGIAYAYSEYIKEEVVINLAKQDARRGVSQEMQRRRGLVQ